MSFSRYFKVVFLAVAAMALHSFAAWSGSYEEPAEKSVVNGRTVVTVYTPEELSWVQGQVASGVTDIDVILGADLVFGPDTSTIDSSTSNYWVPIGSKNNQYQGTFDGAGHTIYGMYVRISPYAGLFQYIGEKGVVKNLRIAHSQFISTGSTGRASSVAAFNYGIIDNVVNQGSVHAIGTSRHAGGIAGSNYGKVTNSTNKGLVESKVNNLYAIAGGIVGGNSGEVSGVENLGIVRAESLREKDSVYTYVGGIVGSMGVESFVVRGVNRGSVEAKCDLNREDTAGPMILAGGIVGYSSTKYGVAVDSSVNYGAVKAFCSMVTSPSDSTYGRVSAGGILGYLLYSEVRHSANYGSVYAEHGYQESFSTMQALAAGGIVGDSYSGTTISDCMNYGDVSGKFNYDYFWFYAGGVVGHARGNVIRSGNMGRVFGGTAKATTAATSNAYAHVGGVAGAINKTLENSFNRGNVVFNSPLKDTFVGGIAGTTGANSVIAHSYSAADTLKGNTLGGVVGWISYSTTVTYVYYDMDRLPKNVAVLGYVANNEVLVDEVVGYATSEMKADKFAWILNTANGSLTNSKLWSRKKDYPVLVGDSLYWVNRVKTKVNYEFTDYYVKGMLTVSDPVPEEGYVFVNWKDETGAKVEKFSTVDRDMIITAVFEEKAIESSSAVVPPASSSTVVPPASSSSKDIASNSAAESSSSEKSSSSIDAEKVSSSSADSEEVSCSSADSEPDSSSDESSSSEQKSSSSVESSSSKDKDGLHQVVTAQFQIRTSGRNIFVQGALSGEKVSVLDMQGRLIAQGYAGISGLTLSVPRVGSYLVRVGKLSLRVNLYI